MKQMYGEIKKNENKTNNRGEYVRKLSDADVIDIKRSLMYGHYITTIAQRFGVSYNTILMIARGKTYKHIHMEGFDAVKEAYTSVMAGHAAQRILRQRILCQASAKAKEGATTISKESRFAV